MKKRIKRILRYLYYLPFVIPNRIQYFFKGVKAGKNHETLGIVRVRNKGLFRMGKNVRINSTKSTHPMGIGYKTFIKVKKGAVLEIGDNTRMSNVSLVAAQQITIGNHVRLGSGAKIYDTDFHSLDPYERTATPERGIAKTKPIIISDYAFIGADSFVLKGVTIGKGAVIGAGSIVTKNVPDFEIWAGNPAKKIGEVKRQSN